MTASTGGGHGTVGNLTASNNTVYAAVQGFLNNDETNPSGYPKAYLNWIFLDDQFNYVSSLSGAVQAASSTYPAATLNTVAPGSQLTMNKNGYLYIWVSNETQGWDVFFDNLSVQHRQGPVLEENHYYPFGLTMQGLSDKAIKTNYAENKFRYNSGTELQNKEFSDGTGLELYETSFRSFDPQLGRFAQIDPLADAFHFFSTYQYAINNPILFSDPSGLRAMSPWENGQYLPKQWVYDDVHTDDNFDDLYDPNMPGAGGGPNPYRAGISNDQMTEEIYASEMKTIVPHLYNLFPEAPYIEPGFKDSYKGIDKYGNPVMRIELISSENDGADYFPFEDLNSEIDKVITIQLNSNSFKDLLSAAERSDEYDGIENTVGFGGEGKDLLKHVHDFEWGSNETTAIFENSGYAFAGASAILDVLDAANNGKWETHNTIDLIATGATLIPGFGEVFGAVWFVGNLVSESINGKSLSQNISTGLFNGH
jgi:RHS repeat-associated protein